MARLSARAVEALHQRPAFTDWLFGRRVAPDVLAELEMVDEVTVAPLLLPFVLDGDQQTRDRVAAVIRSLMRKQPLSAVMQLDDVSRSLYAYYAGDRPAWFTLTAGIARRLAALPDPGPLLGVASFHSSGYVREAAVTALDALPGDEVLPYLLVRLNDWVTPVADAAKRAVMRRTGGSAKAWVNCLPIVTRLGDATRREHADVIDAVFAMLRQPTNRLALEAGFVAPDRAMRRVSYRLAREATTDEDLGRIVARALHDADPTIRFESFRDASARLGGHALAGVLSLAERDSFAPIRRVALETAVERFPDDAVSRARQALLDRNASVRELARFLIARHDPAFSIADHYRERLSGHTDATLSAALAGLAETGVAEDAAVVRPCLASSRSAVRAQALRALAKLDPEPHANLFVASLSDASPRVAHAARWVLEQHPSFIDYATISGLVRHGAYAHTRADALRLADTSGKWASLVLWLETNLSGEPALAEAARKRIARWLDRANLRYTAPRASEISSIEALVARSDGVLSERMVTNIRGFLQPWIGNSRT